MRHALYVILVVSAACAALYFGWSLHRVSARTLMYDPNWPRPFPYPDAWLLSLNDWYGARYPAPPRTMKLHGELERVRLTVRVALALSCVVCAAGAAPIASRLSRRLGAGRGFAVLRSPPPRSATLPAGSAGPDHLLDQGGRDVGGAERL